MQHKWNQIWKRLCFTLDWNIFAVVFVFNVGDRCILHVSLPQMWLASLLFSFEKTIWESCRSVWASFAFINNWSEIVKLVVCVDRTENGFLCTDNNSNSCTWTKKTINMYPGQNNTGYRYPNWETFRRLNLIWFFFLPSIYFVWNNKAVEILLYVLHIINCNLTENARILRKSYRLLFKYDPILALNIGNKMPILFSKSDLSLSQTQNHQRE